MSMLRLVSMLSASALLVACSTDGSNTFMTYEKLQDMVQEHDQKWQSIQPKLERLDELEAQLAQMQGQPNSSSSTSSYPAPANETVITPVETVPVITPVASTPVASAPVVSEPVATAKVAQAEPIAKPAAASISTTKPSEPSGYGVQLASYRSRAEAVRGWRVISQEAPSDYVDLAPRVNTKEVNGWVMHQLKVGPFISKAYSVDFCNMLKQQQKDCLVTRYDGELISSF
ncbi:SPOR domain-containing protein [Marinomonas epiphytica]